jgi:sulfhydrogenase subunit delta
MTGATANDLPTLAVWKFSSCDGCQLTLLDCEDELLQIDKIREVREQSRVLIAIGACATSGGIQALRNFADVDGFTRAVYATPDYITTLAQSTPMSAHVAVDLELRGCPIDKHQLLEVIAAHLGGRRPRVRSHSVCIECKLRGNTCVMVSDGIPCLGPVTHAGCGAICPAYGRGCYGCFGPQDSPNPASLNAHTPWTDVDLVRVYRTFNAAAAPFKEVSEAHER